MLYRNKNKEWDICPFQVRFIREGEEFLQYDYDKEWWLEFAKMWPDTKIIEFIQVVATGEQLERLEKIKNIPDGFGDECSNYVEHGTFPNGIEHRLRNLQLEEINIQQGIQLSEREINEIILGMQVGDIEIELLMMKGEI